MSCGSRFLLWDTTRRVLSQHLLSLFFCPIRTSVPPHSIAPPCHYWINFTGQLRFLSSKVFHIVHHNHSILSLLAHLRAPVLHSPNGVRYDVLAGPVSTALLPRWPVNASINFILHLHNSQSKRGGREHRRIAYCPRIPYVAVEERLSAFCPRGSSGLPAPRGVPTWNRPPNTVIPFLKVRASARGNRSSSPCHLLSPPSLSLF
jgi:hypothetical protein